MTNKALSINTDKDPKKSDLEPLALTRSDWAWPLMFFLSMAMLGLKFPLGYLFVPLILFNRFRHDKYDFIIQLTILLGGYSLHNTFDLFIYPIFVPILISLAAITILRKNFVVKKILAVCLLYLIGILYFVMKSDERFIVQLSGLSYYMTIIYLFVPFVIFSGREFDIRIFFRHLMVYGLIICAFYILDCVIMNGMFFLPYDISWSTFDAYSVFYKPRIHPFTFEFPRRWPPGLFLLIPLVYPIAKMFKLKWWHWALIAGAMLVCRTFTFTLAFVIGYIMCRAKARQLVFYAIGFVAAMTALYFIDGTIGEVTVINADGEDGIETKSSALRIKSQIDQIIFFDENDEETLAQLGTGRGAQIIPKLELLYKLDRQWIGLGFLDRERTTSTKYIIENELYNNPEVADEVATGVESVPFQIILDIGILGLIMHIIIYILFWLIVRKMPHGSAFLCTIGLLAIIGISGFHGLIRTDTLLLAALVFAAVILNDKRNIGGFDLPPVRDGEKAPTLLS
ncbi:MAG: hypothetical protein ACI31C_09220 [Muribaculaceae bacterium]